MTTKKNVGLNVFDGPLAFVAYATLQLDTAMSCPKMQPAPESVHEPWVDEMMAKGIVLVRAPEATPDSTPLDEILMTSIGLGRREHYTWIVNPQPSVTTPKFNINHCTHRVQWLNKH